MTRQPDFRLAITDRITNELIRAEAKCNSRREDNRTMPSASSPLRSLRGVLRPPLAKPRNATIGP
ncbi:hypothetical protein SBA4_6510005 [Candidatus Sulfopaludibacter sp. SbA4]|nr:hypothetical protein SBA4_6510005 [Candidatus Sulfopaludibacter sp. SbA4]